MLCARNGQIMVVAPALVIVVAIVAAFSIDIGSFCYTSLRLQNAADAAALAGVLELWEERARWDMSGEQSCRNDACSEADALAQLNWRLARNEVSIGIWDEAQFTPVDDTLAANAVRVQAYRDGEAPGGPAPGFFCGIVGLDEVNMSAVAVARFRHRPLIPVAVHESLVGPPGSSITLYDDTEIAAGNCGLLDFNGGKKSASDTLDWMRYGYDSPLNIDPSLGCILIAGNPGLESTIILPLEYHIDTADMVCACIFRTVHGHGSWSELEVVGYVALVITGYATVDDSGDDLESVTATVMGSYLVGTGETEGLLRDVMLLQLVD
jgi:hypothetical protein